MINNFYNLIQKNIDFIIKLNVLFFYNYFYNFLMKENIKNYWKKLFLKYNLKKLRIRKF